MAALTYRANLKTTAFPFLTELGGRTVIIKGSDHNQVPGITEKQSITEADQNTGVPQLYYCHNIIPTVQGYKSVGYDSYLTTPLTGVTDMSRQVHVRDGSGNTMLLSLTKSGRLYRLMAGETVWKSVPGAPDSSLIENRRITAAQVGGITYIYFERVGCYFFNFSAELLVPVTLQGLVATDILGLVSSFGYLLAYSKDAFVWSSTVDSTDFVPSLSTGAGGGQVEGARGKIVGVQVIYSAIIVFTDSNAVAGQYTANIRYPFNFTEISGCGGLYDPDYVSYDSNSGAVYAYTTSGLQSITTRTGTVVYPEVTDYLSGSRFEDYDEDLDQLIVVEPTAPVPKQITTVADRYLVISFGISATTTDFTHALIFDMAMKQWAKLKIRHVQCFEMLLYAQDTEETPRKSLAFLQRDGSIHITNFDISAVSSSGVMIFGKYQYVRARLMTLQGIDVEGVVDTDTFSTTILSTLDGKSFIAPSTPTLKNIGNKIRTYNCRVTGINHSLLFKGKFNLTSLLLTFTNHGAR